MVRQSQRPFHFLFTAITDDTFEEPIARPFFAGLLPVGQMHELLAKQYRIGRQNDFALLKEIVGECAGAI